MIVRDEAAVLDRCLDSLAGLPAQLCVVDTGSADQTADIARRRGAEVVRWEGCNDDAGRIVDFASARNQALALARGDWVLQIDADEVLEAGAGLVAGYVAGARVDQVAVAIRSNGAQWLSGRLFRRSNVRGYRSRIHEYLECGGLCVNDPGIRIANLPDKRGKESASDRNLRICLLAAEEDPNDARIAYYLANEYRVIGRIDEALQAYRRSLALGTYAVGRFHATYHLGVCHVLRGEWDLAVQAGQAAIAIDARYAEAHCLVGDAHSCADRPALAVPCYRQALACGQPPANAVFAPELWAYGEHPQRRLRELGVAS
jgi:glycosyltransferase involved in cell wall biosynthesis